MAIVVLKGKTGSKEDIIGAFRRLTLEEDIVEQVKKRTHYQKPSQKRYAKKKIAIWRKKCRRRSKNSRIHATFR